MGVAVQCKLLRIVQRCAEVERSAGCIRWHKQFSLGGAQYVSDSGRVNEARPAADGS